MSEDEVLRSVTSQELEESDFLESDESSVEEMLTQFGEIKDDRSVENPKSIDSQCKGNILTECVRDGLEELESAASESEIDYTVIGGIATQLRGLADCQDIVIIGDHFGQRQTADIDILVNNYSEGLEVQRKYDNNGKPSLDVVYGHIPGDEEMISNSERVDFGSIVDGFDFEVFIPTNEDLIYSKAWNPSLENKEGTRYDLDKHAQLSGYVFDTDESKLRERIKSRAPDTEASIDYLIRAGIDV